MRAMMSVGPPAGNPTTTRTGRLGYPCASDGAAPASSNRLARTQVKTRIVSLSFGQFLVGAIIGEGGPQNKDKTPPRACFTRDSWRAMTEQGKRSESRRQRFARIGAD